MRLTWWTGPCRIGKGEEEVYDYLGTYLSLYQLVDIRDDDWSLNVQKSERRCCLPTLIRFATHDRMWIKMGLTRSIIRTMLPWRILGSQRISAQTRKPQILYDQPCPESTQPAIGR